MHLNWFPCELHTHTEHSDGSFTVESLCKAAKSKGLKLIALTDHNTSAGCLKLTDELRKKTIPAIKGIEWTTFFGHMVVLAADQYVDWRFATVDDIDEKIKEVKDVNGLVGIAHPYRYGSPMCTGCHWDYHVTRWDLVDYIEIWSGLMPSIDKSNHQAIQLWTSLLDRGYKIAATYGRDWHSEGNSMIPSAVTYLGCNKNPITPEAALEALRKGRTFVSLSPIIEILAIQNNQFCTLGDTLSKEPFTLYANVYINYFNNNIADYQIKLNTLDIITQDQTIETIELNPNNKSYQINLSGKDANYMYFKLNGTICNIECTLAITSPIYFEKD